MAGQENTKKGDNQYWLFCVYKLVCMYRDPGGISFISLSHVNHQITGGEMAKSEHTEAMLSETTRRWECDHALSVSTMRPDPTSQSERRAETSNG